MIQFHPEDALLTEYANGSLDWGLSILVSAHLESCPQCKFTVKSAERIGAGLLCHSKAEAPAPDTWEKLIAKITQLPQETPKTPAASSDFSHQDGMPSIVEKIVRRSPSLKWHRMSRSLRVSRLLTGQSKYEVCLHKIRSGGQVSEHDHGGREVTLVIKGSFSDAEGVYRPGDFITKLPGQIHRPTASQNEDCLCLSAVEAPAKLTGFIGRCVNPFLAFKPM